MIMEPKGDPSEELFNCTDSTIYPKGSLLDVELLCQKFPSRVGHQGHQTKCHDKGICDAQIHA